MALHVEDRQHIHQMVVSEEGAWWLEILTKFNYTLKHKAGVKHGNATEDAKTVGNANIEQRDGGPSQLQVEQK